MLTKKRIKDLSDIVKVQTMNGNWNYDPYMHGMANGLILAYHLMTAKRGDLSEPPFLKAPKQWLCGRKSKGKSDHPNNSGEGK